ncbi:MAG: AAA family ATPase, partial [Caldilineaceae bacterium]|nr:AAA family ATPase [Caldilineaceae bacterium]
IIFVDYASSTLNCGGTAEWDTEFNLSINPVDKADIIKNLVGFEVIDKALQQATDPRRQGQGFQRHLVYTLIRLAAKYQTPAAPTDRKEFKPSLTLYLFEEPEAFLHPTQQDVLCRSLKKLAAQEGNQVLLTSHSPHFVSHNTMDIPSIIRLSRPQARTLVGQIDQSRLEAIFADNQAINALVKPHDDDYKLDMEAIKYFLWLGPERCGVFFSRHVLMVEGPTEYVLLRHLIDEGRIEPPTGGVFILDCMGKYNFHRFMHILGALNVSHSILFDGDANKPPHDRIHRLICETCNGHTKEVAVFPDDIETFLGIEEPKETRRKPQHLMLQLREGAITEERIDALVALVDRLIRV